MSRKPARTNQRMAEKIVQIFKKNNLSITIQANLQVIDFLDVTLDLSNGSYKPFVKPGQISLYVHSKSKHPACVIKQILLGVEKRISNLCSTKQIFNESKIYFEDCLKKSGYSKQLQYKPDPDFGKQKKKVMRKQATWFNSPWDGGVKTKVAQEFLGILDQ